MTYKRKCSSVCVCVCVCQPSEWRCNIPVNGAPVNGISDFKCDRLTAGAVIAFHGKFSTYVCASGLRVAHDINPVFSRDTVTRRFLNPFVAIYRNSSRQNEKGKKAGEEKNGRTNANFRRGETSDVNRPIGSRVHRHQARSLCACANEIRAFLPLVLHHTRAHIFPSARNIYYRIRR